MTLRAGDDKCVDLSFGWAATFKLSIFQREVLSEIVPILMVLKKMALTHISNTSLRLVLARRLVSMKLKYGIMDPAELPSSFLAMNAGKFEDGRSLATTH